MNLKLENVISRNWLQYLKGDTKKEYRLTHEQIDSYAKAIVKACKVICDEKPTHIFIPLRGSYFPTSIIFSLFDRLCKTDAKLPKIVSAPTSGFVEGREKIIYSTFENIIHSSEEAPRILTVDTAITGTSIRDFRKKIKSYIPEIMEKAVKKAEKRYSDFSRKDDVPLINYSLIKIWGNRPNVKRPSKGAFEKQKNSIKLRIVDYNIGVEDLIAEDDPILLGIDYSIDLGNGKKAPFLLPVYSKNPLQLKNHSGNIVDVPVSKNTSSTVKEMILDSVYRMI